MNKKNSIEKISEQQFDKWAVKYEKGVWNKYFTKSIKHAVQLANIQKTSKVLDLGCGTGKLSILLTENPFIEQIIGMDISQNMIRQAKYKQKYFRLGDKVNFMVGNSNNLNFDNGYFDYVFCLNSFHHYPSQSKVLEEVFRVMKSGGRFILLDPFRDNILRKTWAVALKKIFNEDYADYQTKSAIQEMLLNCGFHNLHQETYLYFTLFTISEKN